MWTQAPAPNICIPTGQNTDYFKFSSAELFPIPIPLSLPLPSLSPLPLPLPTQFMYEDQTQLEDLIFSSRREFYEPVSLCVLSKFPFFDTFQVSNLMM